MTFPLGFRARQLVALGLTANAIRPVRGQRAILPAFLAGWLTSELSPQLLALQLADAGLQARRGRLDRTGLALTGASVAGLAWLTWSAHGAGALAEHQLAESLGADYRDRLPAPPSADDLRTPWRQLARPFRMRDPQVRVVRDVQYAGRGSRGRLDLYLPPEGEQALADAPVLLQIHGGAWTVGSKEQQGQLLMNRMAARGWVCVAVNYRLAPKHPWPTQIVDVKRALAWTREHVAAYGGDPGYVVLTGGSAGGHLAALAALTPNDPQWQPGFEDADTTVQGCVPFYGVYDLAGASGDGPSVAMRDGFLAPRVFRRPFRGHEEDFRQASPLLRITADAPDFCVIHGTLDSLVPVSQARAFVAALRATSQRPVTYTELPGAQHAFEVFSSIRSQHVVRAVERWLEWHRARRADAA